MHTFLVEHVDNDESHTLYVFNVSKLMKKSGYMSILSEICWSTLCMLAAISIIFSAFRDTPRKRGGAMSGSSGSGRSATTVCSINAEPQPEEAVDENFPVSRSVCLLNIKTF